MSTAQCELLTLIIITLHRRGQVRGLFPLAVELERDYRQTHRELHRLEGRKLVNVQRRAPGSPLIIHLTPQCCDHCPVRVCESCPLGQQKGTYEHHCN
jgi:hypothetical protein